MKYVLGIGAIAAVGFLLWYTLRKKPIIDPYEGTKYEGMTEAEAQAYYNELMATTEEAVAQYIEDPQTVEEAQLEALGITKDELPTYQDFALQINEELGGSYVAGVLTPPASWTGSVTEWSRYIQQVTNVRWHQLYG